MTALLLILKSSIVLLVALAAAGALQRGSSALRHWILAAGICGALILPVASAVTPAWPLPMPEVPAIERNPPAPPLSPPGERPDATLKASAAAPAIGVAELLIGIWAAGALALVTMIGVGLVGLRRIARTATEVTSEWAIPVAAIGRELGITRPVRVFLTGHRLAPMTWGYRAPRILLPEHAASWSAARRRVVIAHELAHVSRGDWASHLAGELVRAIYWFNPLAWLACRVRQQESERACDDRVLALGIDGHDYAALLVDLARAVTRNPWLPAPAIVRASGLERRVRAMLNPAVNRRGMTMRERVAIGAVAAAVIVTLAGVSAAQALASFGGSVVDPQNAVLPAVRLVMTNADTQAKIEVRSDRNGRFEFPPLLPGTYDVLVELPGFASLSSTVRLEAGQRMEPGLKLEVGSLEETVTVRDPGPGAVETPRMQSATARPIPPCPAPSTARVGGNIRPPYRTRNVAPMYPVSLRGSGRSGNVEFVGTIGIDGTIVELNTIGSSDPLFEQAAADAVRQWEWDATLLNCEPIPVEVRIHVYFAS